MTSIDLPDVQSRISTNTFKLTRVGVTDVKKLVHIQRPHKEQHPLIVTMDLFVDLPAQQKGSHMSRNLELIGEIIDSKLETPFSSLESFCSKITKTMFDKHPYATYAEIKAQADYFRETTYPDGRKGSEPYTLIAEARGTHKGDIKKMIGVTAIGMTACPCAMEVLQELAKRDKEFPVPSHNQRNIGTLLIEVPQDVTEVEADDLIEILEHSFSSPTYSILKRQQEAELVLKAHQNPRFVEDVVREMLRQILKRYPTLPDEVLVIARSESEESIHKHNAYAERVTTLKELRQ